MKLENGWLSREEVTKLLKIKDITLARWVKFGLFTPIIVNGNAQYYDRDKIEEFIANHITTEEAAELLGVGKLTVQKWTRNGRLSGACVSGPNIDGYHSNIFNRDKLIHWRDQRLTLSDVL
jgi:excisionase family DNA binding protein